MRDNLIPQRKIKLNSRINKCDVCDDGLGDGWRLFSSDQSVNSGSKIAPKCRGQLCVCVTHQLIYKGVMFANAKHPLAQKATNQCQQRNLRVELQGLDCRVRRAILAPTLRGRSFIALPASFTCLSIYTLF